MAVLYITEYSVPMNSQYNNFPGEPNNAEQHVAIGAGSVQSAAFDNRTNFVRLQADAVCSIAFGTNPTAVNTAHRLPANVIEELWVPQGASWKIAVITNT